MRKYLYHQVLLQKPGSPLGSLSSRSRNSVIVVLVPLAPILTYLYLKYWKAAFTFWEKLGVPHLPGSIPYGSDKEWTEGKTFRGKLLEKLCKKFPNQPQFGVYQGPEPYLIVKDPDSVRLVLAKEFSHFRDRRLIKTTDDDILSKHLFLLDGDMWRALRVKMTPVFTSGKLKSMFPLFVKCSESLENSLLTKIESDVDIKNVTSRFSTDVIVSNAFGLESDAINNDNDTFLKFSSPNRIGKPPTFKETLEAYVTALKKKYFPFLVKMQKIRLAPKVFEDFMVNTVKATLEHRRKTGLKRNDFIDLLIQLQDKGNLAENNEEQQNVEPIVLTLELTTAQCGVFFAAGHETSSSVKTFALYELALHQEIQDKLRKEINDTIEKHGGLTYQAVQEMEYLDMVANETMRKYPTLQELNRCCTSDFTFPNGDKVTAGTKIIIPTWTIHYNPEIYPDPEKFDPERFTNENRESRHPFAFLPFGEGPRICIGSRFGLLQVKVGLIAFLRKFKVEKSPKTVVPLTFQGTAHTVTSPEQPIVLKLTKVS